MAKLFRKRGATGQQEPDLPWPGFRVSGTHAPRESAPLLTQGTLVDASVTVEIDSRAISSGVVGPGCVPLTGGWPVQVFNADPFGAYLQLAQDVSQICAFTCFDRSSALVATDDEPVPSGGPGMSICYVSTGSYDVNTGNYVNTGGGARLVLAADPGVLKITCPTTPVSWDFECQRVIPFSAAAGQLPVRYIVKPLAFAWVVARGRWEMNAAVIVQI